MNPDYTAVSGRIARTAQLAMLLEVSASPKPGNVDREHNYPDTCYEHFLASSVGVYPVLEKAAGSKAGIGNLLVNAVSESMGWQRGGNTHFGAFLLLIPLTMAAGEILKEKDRSTGPAILEAGDFEALVSRAHAFVRATGPEDAVEFYRAFEAGGVRVNSVDEFDLEDPNSTSALQEQNVTLYDLMKISEGYDLIANEWTTGFRRCLEGALSILDILQARTGNSNSDKSNPNELIIDKPTPDQTCSETGINEAVVYTFLKLLSRHRDTFIQTKFDADTADRVSARARLILSDWEAKGSGPDSAPGIGDFSTLLHSIREFDIELLEKRINPGSTADIIIASLFIALLGGLRI